MALIFAAGGPQATKLEVSNGRDVVAAMHARYAGKWYRNFTLVQDVTYFKDGQPERQERIAEYIALPGRVRSVTGKIEEGNVEIYTDGTFYRFQQGKLTGQLKTVHGVLLLGFDVYVQDPAVTLGQITELKVDLDALSAGKWKGRPVWIVGAAAEQPERNQFWIDQERLVCVRLVTRRPSGVLVDVEMDGYERLGDGWIATELVFRRNGQMAIREQYVEYGIVESLDPSLFDITRVQPHP